MFARIISIPLLLAALILGYLSWKVDDRFIVPMIVPILLLAIIYVLTPQVNWWWYKKKPAALSPAIVEIFDRFIAFYKKLDPEQQDRFRQRASLYMMGVEFMPMVFEKVPLDIQAILAAQAVQVTFGEEDFIMAPYERIIVYPHPFPSPQYPETFHASEVYKPDSVLLFSADQVIQGFSTPSKFYNVGMHEYVKVFIDTHPQVLFPEPGEEIWPALEQIGGLSKSFIEACLGLPAVEALHVSINHFFTFPDRFEQTLPELYGTYKNIFKI